MSWRLKLIDNGRGEWRPYEYIYMSRVESVIFRVAEEIVPPDALALGGLPAAI